jgi:DNA invertase Pin-like site-specific DNA recombinase
MPKKERDEIIVKLLEEGISKSALERATGISRGTIARIAQKVTRP